GIELAGIAFAPHPAHLVPRVALAGRHLRHEVKPHETRPGPCLRLQLLDVKDPRRLVRDDRIGHALSANPCGQRPRIDPANRYDATPLEPSIEMLNRAV